MSKSVAPRSLLDAPNEIESVIGDAECAIDDAWEALSAHCGEKSATQCAKLWMPS